MKKLLVLAAFVFAGSSLAIDIDIESNSNVFEQGVAYLYCDLTCEDGKGWTDNQEDYKKVKGHFYPLTGIWLQVENGLTNYFNRIYVVSKSDFKAMQSVCQEDFAQLVKNNSDIHTRMNVIGSLEENQCKVKAYVRPNSRPNVLFGKKYSLAMEEKVLEGGGQLKEKYCHIKNNILKLQDSRCASFEVLINEDL